LAAIDVVENDGVIVGEGFSTTIESMKILTSRSFRIFSKKVGGIVHTGTKTVWIWPKSEPSETIQDGS